MCVEWQWWIGCCILCWKLFQSNDVSCLQVPSGPGDWWCAGLGRRWAEDPRTKQVRGCLQGGQDWIKINLVVLEKNSLAGGLRR